MSRNVGIELALPRLTSFFATLGIGRNAALQSVHALAEQSILNSTTRASLTNTFTNNKHFLRLLQEQRWQQPMFASQAQLLHSSGAKVSQSRAASSELSAYLRLRAGQNAASISSHPSSIAYGAVRQQHAGAVPPASAVSPASAVPPTSSSQAVPAAQKVAHESGGGKQEGGGGGAKKSFFSNLQDVPIVPLLLGFAGAIPFVALAPPIAPLLPLPEDMYARRADWHAAYGAVIASFLGAVHWGLAMAEHAPRGSIASFSLATLRYTWGVIPALLAWPALLLTPADKFAALSGTIGLAFLVDSGFAYFKLLPKWYTPLRLSLTILAVGSLASSWSVAAVKSTYNRARTFELGKEEPPPTAVAAKPERKVL